jgi:hypothetical protein
MPRCGGVGTEGGIRAGVGEVFLMQFLASINHGGRRHTMAVTRPHSWHRSILCGYNGDVRPDCCGVAAPCWGRGARVTRAPYWDPRGARCNLLLNPLR